MLRTNRLTSFSILCALALVIGYFESLLPVFSVIPGGKIGLANVVTMVVFFKMGKKSSLLFGVLRCLLSAVIFSGFSAFLYSFAGTILSLFSMMVAKQIFKTKISEIGISIIGATLFNVGQILVCAALLQSIVVLRYLPALLVISSVAGVVTGFLAQKLNLYLKEKEF